MKRRSSSRVGPCIAWMVMTFVAGACSAPDAGGWPATTVPATTTTTTIPATTTTTTGSVVEEPLDHAALQAVLDEWYAASGAGAAAAVLRAGGTAWTGSAGMADRSTGRVLTSGDTFRIGSITKTFTAAVVLQLVEEGALGLDQPVAEVLPALGLDPAITVRHVLGHRSGLRDGLEEAALGSEPADPGLVMVLSTRGGLLFDPGTRFDYCNANYILAALLIEAVDESPAHTAIRDRIIVPLGLEATFMAGFEDGEVTALPDGDPAQAAGYEAFDRTNFTAGAMAATPEDLARFVAALFGGALLEPATIDEMVTAGGSYGEGAEYGLGVELADWAGDAAWGHRGGVRGYLSGVFYFPEDGMSVAVVSNAWRAGDVWELLESIVGIARAAG